jgi:hypothetical protein
MGNDRVEAVATSGVVGLRFDLPGLRGELLMELLLLTEDFKEPGTL